jgi:hypothetical protein
MTDDTARWTGGLDACTHVMRAEQGLSATRSDSQFTCFTGTEVQVLTQRALVRLIGDPQRLSVYLLYWYRSTIADAAGGRVTYVLRVNTRFSSRVCMLV